MKFLRYFTTYLGNFYHNYILVIQVNNENDLFRKRNLKSKLAERLHKILKSSYINNNKKFVIKIKQIPDILNLNSLKKFASN